MMWYYIFEIIIPLKEIIRWYHEVMWYHMFEIACYKKGINKWYHIIEIVILVNKFWEIKQKWKWLYESQFDFATSLIKFYDIMSDLRYLLFTLFWYHIHSMLFIDITKID